jgi:hypothetical protein
MGPRFVGTQTDRRALIRRLSEEPWAATSEELAARLRDLQSSLPTEPGHWLETYRVFARTELRLKEAATQDLEFALPRSEAACFRCATQQFLKTRAPEALEALVAANGRFNASIATAELKFRVMQRVVAEPDFRGREIQALGDALTSFASELRVAADAANTLGQKNRILELMSRFYGLRGSNLKFTMAFEAWKRNPRTFKLRGALRFMNQSLQQLQLRAFEP